MCIKKQTLSKILHLIVLPVLSVLFFPYMLGVAIALFAACVIIGIAVFGFKTLH